MISKPKEYSLGMGTLVESVIQFLLCRLTVGTSMIISDMGVIKQNFSYLINILQNTFPVFLIQSQRSSRVEILIASLLLIFA